MLEEQKRNEAALVDSTLSTTIDFEGHPGDIRFVVLSYDDTQILSVSTSIISFFHFILLVYLNMVRLCKGFQLQDTKMY